MSLGGCCLLNRFELFRSLLIEEDLNVFHERDVGKVGLTQTPPKVKNQTGWLGQKPQSFEAVPKGALFCRKYP